MRQRSMTGGAFFLAAYVYETSPTPEALTVTAIGVAIAAYAVYCHLRSRSEPNWTFFSEMLRGRWKSHG